MYNAKRLKNGIQMKKKSLSSAALVAAGVVAGVVIAGTGANADTTTTTTLPSPTVSSPATGTTPDGDGHFGRHGGRGHGPHGAMNDRSATPIRDDEKALSTTDAAKVKAAAEAAVTGGTVFRVESDAGDGKYEAHVAKADGTVVTVKFDADFKVIAIQDGMGLGDPRPAHVDPTTPTVKN
ncbi:MAG: hypothetical protein EBQ63_05845 [Actinobacteria bacterium]|nr:hypothetical protein [Actinomycetota bacterium]